MRREIFLQAGGFDPEIPAAEDFDLWLRITLHHRVGLCPETHSIRQGGRPDQLSALPGLDRYRILGLSKILERLPKNEERRTIAGQNWGEKLAIFEKGCRKRENQEGLDFCQSQKDRFPDIWLEMNPSAPGGNRSRP
jgi:hypothetical protein